MAEKSSEKKTCCAACRWGKRIAKILGGVIIVVLILLICVIAAINPIVKTAVPAIGSKVTGTEVKLGDCDISVLRGSLELKDLSIGNPEGYNTPTMMSVGKIYVKVNLFSVLSDTIQVNKVEIVDPEITYEVGLGNSNVGTLLEHLSKPAEPEAEEAKPEEETKQAEVEEEPAAKEGGKKVVIDEVVVSGGSVHLSAKLMQGTALPIPLPTITLNDIGKAEDENAEDEGVSIAEATGDILKSICTSAVDVAGKAWEGIKDLGKATGKAIGNAVDATGEALGNAADAVKNLFK
jgi:uncharacterized protein involved in outer membrane biogenesis